MRAQITNESLEWLREHKISLQNRGRERIKVGDWISFLDNCEVEPYVEFNAGHSMCQMGTMSFTNSHVPPELVVGRYSSVAPGLNIHGWRHPVEHISTNVFTHDSHTSLTKMFIADHKSDYRNFFPNPQRQIPRIANDVWVGANVTLARGISLATGSVIAANSVVVKSVGPYEIVGGNPAKLIRKRFSQETINLLLESEWWRYKFTDFAGLDVSNPDKFLEGFFKRKSSLEVYNPVKIRLSGMPHNQ